MGIDEANQHSLSRMVEGASQIQRSITFTRQTAKVEGMMPTTALERTVIYLLLIRS